MVKVGGAFIQIIISSHDKPSLKIILGFTTKGFRRPEVALANIGFESQPDILLLFVIRRVSKYNGNLFFVKFFNVLLLLIFFINII